MVTGSFPKWIVLQLLRACNLNCRMCYEWGSEGAYTDKDKNEALPMELVEKLILESAPHRPHFELFGGEPFLYPRIHEVIHLIKSMGSTLHIPTNGTLLRRNSLPLVKEEVDLVWVSLDGPRPVNDAQRGKGVFETAIQGISEIHALKQQYRKKLPELGIAFVLTPDNCHAISDFFLDAIDLDIIDRVSIEFLNYLSPKDHSAYQKFLAKNFNITRAPYTKGFMRSLSDFHDMDFGLISSQIAQVREVCRTKNIKFITRPGITGRYNVQAYFKGEFHRMVDRRSRCPLPFLYFEIASSGEVTPCHGFYDLTIGNVRDATIKEIWDSPGLKKIQAHARKGLLPVCTGCCQYYL